MSDWTVATLDQLGQIFDGPHATPTRQAAGPYFLNIASLSGGRLDLTLSDHVSTEDFAKWTRRVTPRADDLLFSYETRLGEAALMPADIEACLGRRMALIRPKRDRVNPRFLLYLYLAPQFQSTIEQNTIHGATVNRIPLNRMGAWEVSLPPVPEQQAIAEVLGALDDKIAANTALVANTASVAMAEYRSAIRDGGLELPIDEVSILLARGITPRYLPDGDGTRVLNQKCVRDQLVSLEPSRWTDDAKVKQEKLLAVGDILVNSTGQGTLGRVARWTLSERAAVDSHITIVRPDSDVSDPAVIGQAILAIEADIEALGEGSTGQTELSRVELGRARIRIPSRERAEHLGAKLRALSVCQDAARAENDTLAATRDALLPQLMSGKLRVRDAEDPIVQAGV